VLPASGCTSVDMSPDKTRLYARMYFADWNEGYRGFDTETYDVVRDYQHIDSCPWEGRVSADNQFLWTTNYYKGRVDKVNLTTGATVLSVSVGSWPMGVAYDSSRRFLYTGQGCSGTGGSGSIKVVDTFTNSLVAGIPLSGEPGTNIIVSSTNEYVYALSRRLSADTQLYKIRTSDYSVQGVVDILGSGPGVGASGHDQGLSLSPDGSKAYVGSVVDDTLRVIDTASMTQAAAWSLPDVLGFNASPDGTHALVTSGDSSHVQIRVFDLSSQNVLQTLTIGDIGDVSLSHLNHLAYWDWDASLNAVYIPVCSSKGGVAVLVPGVPGDFNGDGFVTIADVELLEAVRGTTVPPTDARYDLSPDGHINLADAEKLVKDIIGTSMADTNLDHKVDILDLGNMANKYGFIGTFADGDTNFDNVVNILDLGNLANDYGKSYPVTAGGLVPEPATLALLTLGGLAMLRRRRK
jgi:DNA-binding beta-propeller fold protein YncE